MQLQKSYRLGIRPDIATSDQVLNYCYVAPGWNNLITELLKDLDSSEYNWDCCILQVKEKFGTLRFYVGAADNKTWERIQQAEHDSAKICMHCGEPGRVYYDGWMAALCPKHAAEEGRDSDLEDF